jgi:hypothetical protein
MTDLSTRNAIRFFLFVSLSLSVSLSSLLFCRIDLDRCGAVPLSVSLVIVSFILVEKLFQERKKDLKKMDMILT